MVAGWLWFENKRISFSSIPLGCGDDGGEPGWIEIGGGDGVAELIDSCVTKFGSFEFSGDSGGSEMQIDACWIESFWRSWIDFYEGK